MVELVTFGETPLRLSPPGKERIELADSVELNADGTESNVAATATELGTDSLWVSKLPNSATGRNVLRQIRSTGVQTDITWTDGIPRQGLTFSELSADPRKSQDWYDREETALSTAEPGELPMNKIQDASLVYTALSTAVLSEQALNTAASILRASSSGAVTAVEIDYEPGLRQPEAYNEAFKHVSEHVDVLVTSEDVVSEILGEEGRPREEANTLSAKYDLQIVVIRRQDGSGVALHDSPGTNVIHERDTVETEIVDSSGSESAFTAGFLHELIQGSDASRALTTAVATGAFAKTVPGNFLNIQGDEIETIANRVVENSQ
jgi:2-dehydro-3-deoxygluconokinase